MKPSKTRSTPRVTTRSIVTVALAAIALTAALPSSASASVSFGSRSDYGTGAPTPSVAIGQLTAGGIPDLAVASGGSVKLFLGSGGRTFTPGTPVNFDGGALTGNDTIFPESVAIGDVNGDGLQDLAVAGAQANFSMSSLGVALGNGDGTFDPPVLVAPGVDFHAVLQSIVIADLDGDTLPDLAAADPAAKTVSVAIGDGDGTFDPPVDIPVPTFPNAFAIEGPDALAVDDLDDDGDLDIVTGNDDGTVSVLEGDGAGTFAGSVQYPAGDATGGQFAAGVAVDDLNGDGNSDVVFTSPGNGGETGSTVVLDGNGDATLDAPRSLPGPAAYAVAIDDLNADGEPDIATSTVDNSASVYEGNGDGSFAAPQSFAVGNEAKSIAAGDLDDDESTDLVVANRFSQSISVLWNTAEPTAELDASSLSFGSRRVGTTSAAQSLTVTNHGAAPLHPVDAQVVGGSDDDFFVVGDTCTDQTLMPDESCELRLRFSPQAPGPRSATLEVTDDAGDSPQEVDLSGNGLAGPTATASPASVAFADQASGTTGAAQPVTLTNDGDDDLHVSTASHGGADASSFQLAANACEGATIAPAESCQVQVAFTPTGDGARTASLRFADDAPGSPQIVALSGTSIGPVPPGKATPTISTQASAGVILGGSIADTATLAGGRSPGGEITFLLYGPDDASCSTAPAFTDMAPVAGNGGYASEPFTPTAPGTYRWVASYSGDADNEVAAGLCDEPSERVTVTPPATDPPDVPDPPDAPDPPEVPDPPDAPDPPVVSDLRLTPHRFEAGGAGGTTIRFDLSDDAAVQFRVMPAPPRGEAVGPVSRARGFNRELPAGPQVERFTGSIGGRTLKRGRYLMFVWATNENGSSTKRESIPFRVVGR